MNETASAGNPALQLIFALAIYLAPTIIAWAKGRHRRVAITVWNVLTGWTIVGWIVTLIWAMGGAKAVAKATPASGENAPLSSGAPIKAVGAGGTVTFDGREISITRKGGLSFLIHGLAGEKNIPITAVQAVQLRKAGFGVRGYIQLTILGGIENRGGAVGAAGDENSCLFDEPQQPEFERLAAAIRQAIGRPSAAPASGNQVLVDIQKAKELLDAGAISETEFNEMKSRILAG